MAEKPIKAPLPADLPEDWNAGQIVSPDGTDVGLTDKHGYNYLMRMVNRAQQGVNAVNDAFETVSGKRTCRFVVGTSTAGWTEADCDFLCDGVDDQEEIQKAINALPKPPSGVTLFTPGEIVILTGEYHLTGTIRTSTDCVLRGSSQGTVLFRDTENGFEEEKNAIISLNPGSIFRNFSIVDAAITSDKTKRNSALLSSWGTNTIENIDFAGGKSSAIGNSSTIGIYLYQDNGSQKAVWNGTIIKNCMFKSFDTAILMNGSKGSHATIESNQVHSGVESFVDVEFGEFVGTPSAFSIVGNTAEESFVRIKTSGSAISILGNRFRRIEVTNPNSAPDRIKIANIIANNILACASDFLTTPAISLGENTCGWFVTGNQVRIPTESEKYWPIVDNGIKNDVRFNSDDAGGSGGTAGVTSFNGRSGRVVPLSGDYSASDVGAVASSTAQDIAAVTQAEYDALPEKNPATLYLIKE